MDNKIFAVGGAISYTSNYSDITRGTTQTVEAYNLSLDQPTLSDGLLVRKPRIVDFSNSIVTNLGSLRSISAKAGVTNEGQTQKNIKLMVVLYDTNNTVKDIVYTDTMVLPGNTDCIESSLALPASVHGFKVKVFVWDSILDMRPLYTTTILQ